MKTYLLRILANEHRILYEYQYLIHRATTLDEAQRLFDEMRDALRDARKLHDEAEVAQHG